MCFHKKEKIRFIEMEFQKVNLGKDDIVVLSHPSHLCEEALYHLRESVENTFIGHNIIILEEGMKIGILSPDK